MPRKTTEGEGDGLLVPHPMTMQTIVGEVVKRVSRVPDSPWYQEQCKDQATGETLRIEFESGLVVEFGSTYSHSMVMMEEVKAV